MADIEDVVEDLNEKISKVADDTKRWSQGESAEIYEEVASVCTMRAEQIRREMAG